MNVYSLSHVTKKFGERVVLDIHSLKIKKGLIYALLGPNGTGKTTLLNILALLDRPSSGEVSFFEKRVDFSDRFLHRTRRRVVMVDQNPILFSTTVHKNIDFGLKIRHLPKKERQILIADSLDMVGMRHLEYQPAHKLSGGETQRVVLARALALSPDVILCDEPTANVDSENQSVIVELLRQINAEKGITLIFTSHNQQSFESLPHHSFYLERGQMIEQSYANIFSARMTPLGPQSSKCSIRDIIELELPVCVTGDVRVSIDPTLIRVDKTLKKNSNSGNQEFKIIQIVSDNGNIQLTLENQIKLSVAIPLEVYREKQFMVGDHVEITLPTDSITFIESSR